MKQLVLIAIGLFLFGSADAQYKYTPEDSAGIMRMRKWEKKAMKKSDRKLMYDVGFLYERIYRKYKDTSINAAIRMYKESAYAEGPLQETESVLSAKQLADIYSHGIGTKRDPEQALIYYYISWFEGADSLEALKKRLGPIDRVEYGSAQTDSIVISFHPLVKIGSEATKKLMTGLEKRLRDHPEYMYRVDVILPNESTTAIYNYYMSQDLPRIIDAGLYEMLESISVDRRINNQFYENWSGQGTRAKLVLVILKERPADR
jgi:hypothetical protein